MRKNRELSIKLTNSFTFSDNAATKKLLGGLPFQLTAGQKKAWKQITEDLKSAQVMNRLIQGDVGSGKTIVATLCLIHAAGNGYQGAIMAPTEVLATQHFQTISKYNEDYGLGIHPELLAGSMTASQKKAAYARIKSGESDVIIGTHALIQEKVEYKSLAMVVTDEQHRFGVRQRETLSQKGVNPHILVMSATPIPRTLAIVLYGDLSVSTIRDLPGGRKPIKNCVVGTKFRPKAYEFIQKEVEAGHQAYVICPQVEEGEMDDLENVQDYAEKLKAALPPSIRVAFLHGKMKPGEKNDIMNSFAEKAIDVLVSTTVIEVGINVPNATIMMIENAERFGLSQLHQLRGRVGRGDAQSYCIFLSTKEDEKTMNRLKILNDSNDGFEIANEDLKLRGPGELFGIRQSGDLAFQIADIYADADMLTAASEEIDTLLKEDAHLRSLEHRDLLEEFNKRQASSMSLHTI